ncbi:MAG: hypothetical protein OEZ68_06535 [Gammaproteobacteria bacterium]|nr:hypothetical protein [Gammaproteobacteria bacterium]MDH5800447.1 hypothetical protein [Gammaproteobacteria bacterium]
MKYSAKPYELVLPDEYLKSPVWIMALEDSDLPGWDETWRKPVSGSANVPDKSTGLFIGLRIRNFDIIANALFFDKVMFPLAPDGNAECDWIGEILIWHDDAWKSPSHVSLNDFAFPIIFEAIPTIRNEERVLFTLKNKDSLCAIKTD